ncbi:hypothetical protein MO973_43785 [Paenibacillus sp. TRM 82003]|nr:hypothetical protein [Paenibacillus sp. TRM 82003]
MRRKAILLSTVITASTVAAGAAASSVLDRIAEPAVAEAAAGANAGKGVWIAPKLTTLQASNYSSDSTTQLLAAS